MKNQAIADLPELSSELEGASFGDLRLTERLKVIVDAAAERPGGSFPEQAATPAAIEATYRFLNNERVTAAEILRPHVFCTVSRSSQAGLILAIHDSTEFEFDGDSRDELGWLSPTKRGFIGHFSLAVSADGFKRPLGLLGLTTIFRPPFERSGPKKKTKWGSNDLNGEARRWRELALEVAERVTPVAEVIHVMDREADAFPLLASLVGARQRFVIRALHDRATVDEGSSAGVSRLFSLLNEAHGVIERKVKLSKRKPHLAPQANKKHPPREERLATLHFSAIQATLRRPQRTTTLPEHLAINVVRVWEPQPPEGHEPIEWRLLTTEPVSTPEQVLAVVDWYRARWVIEEFFKALKTGCAFEKRQIESKHAMLNALAVLAPVAWRLLLLRTLAQTAEDAPATEVFTSTQLDILKAINKKLKLKIRFSRCATVKQAFLAIAALGVHLNKTRPPGWQVLGRGLDKLLLIELGWNAHADYNHM